MKLANANFAGANLTHTPRPTEEKIFSKTIDKKYKFCYNNNCQEVRDCPPTSVVDVRKHLKKLKKV